MTTEVEIVRPETIVTVIGREPTEEEIMMEQVNKATQHAEKYTEIFSMVITLFNYKQRSQYRLGKLEFLFTPMLASKMIRVTLLARGGYIASDTKLLEHTVYYDKDWACRKVDHMIAHVMRYGLKQLFLQGEKVSDDAFL